MPPIFNKESFDLEEGEQVPEHIEDWPFRHEPDPAKYWLLGTDTFSYEDYVVAIDIDDLETARFLARARDRHLNRTQPNAGSIRDRVTVMAPGARLRG